MEHEEKGAGLLRRQTARRDGPPGLVDGILGNVVRLALVVEAEHEEICPGPQEHPRGCGKDLGPRERGTHHETRCNEGVDGAKEKGWDYNVSNIIATCQVHCTAVVR